MAQKVKLKVEKKDGGFYFPQVDIHVVAETEKEAKELIKNTHGIDLDQTVKDLNTPVEPQFDPNLQ